MAVSMLHFVRGSAIVFVNGVSAVDDALWARYCNDVATIARTTKARVLVRSLGGAPSARQRQRAAAVGASGESLTSAVVTESAVSRGVVSALKWLGLDIAAFNTSRVQEAFDFLHYDDAERAWALEKIEEGLAQVIPQRAEASQAQ